MPQKEINENFQLCAQLRVCSQAGGNPVYPRLANQIIASLGMMSVTAFDKRRQQESRVE